MSKSKRQAANTLKIKDTLGDRTKVEVQEAVELLQSLEHPKFKDGTTLELHFKLNINPTKSDQLIRSSVTLPNGTGQNIRIAAFVTAANESVAKEAGAAVVGGEELIDQIKANGKLDFDIAIAEPEMMKKLPVIARTLGVAGMMPNPKTGTVGTDIAGMIEPLLKGKLNFKNDKTGNVHLICGKFNDKFTVEQLVENVEAAIDAIEKSKPDVIKKKFIESAYLTTTMSPSIRVI